MPLRSARTITDLYDATATYDAVIAPDGALCQALNRRIRSPRMGRFAATPRTRTSNQFNPSERRLVFHELIDRGDFTWQEAAYITSAILDCWDETGDPHSILDYNQYDTTLSKSALPIISESASVRNRMMEAPILADQDVAVLGREFLTSLDHRQIPDDSDYLSIFSSETMTVPAVSILPSATAIVETLLANIDPQQADQVAVVMDRSGPISTLVEAALETANIPYYGGPKFIEDPGVRTYLSIAHAGDEYQHLRLKDLTSILATCGIDHSVNDLEKRVVTLHDPGLEPVKQLLQNVEEYTFVGLLEQVEEMCAISLRSLREELALLGLTDHQINSRQVEDLRYYLNSFEIPTERNTRGVILADATTAMWVDRPLVFYLGLDTQWNRPIPEKPWIDPVARDQQNLTAFEILLQNGIERHYLVSESTGGKSVSPCLYFHELLDKPKTDFTEFPHSIYDGPVDPNHTGFGYVPVEAKANPPSTLSQSNLNTFANCPLDYCFDQLVESSDQIYFMRGTLLHDYAEFYLNHREFVDQLETQEIIGLILDELDAFIDRPARAILETEMMLGIEIIETFLAENPPMTREYDEYRDNFWSNHFADYYNRPITSPVTERYFKNWKIGVSGVIDLIRSPTELIDYKTGRSHSVQRLIEKSKVDPIHDEPDFQALMYLAHHRTVAPNEPIDFVFFHILDLLDDAIHGNFNTADGEVRLRYLPEPFPSYLGSKEAYELIIGDVAASNDRRKTLERFGYDAFHSFVTNNSLPELSSEAALLDSPFAEVLRRELQESVGEYKYVESGGKMALKAIYQLRNQFVFPSDVNAVEAFVDASIDQIKHFHQSQFPTGDPNHDRLSHPDMVSIDE